MNTDCVFNDLREKLDILGYTQPLPLAAVSLVSALFNDLVKTTESLRDSKLKINSLLEEKSCWELGVEPYKCDNARLLAQCNQLQLELINQKDDYEARICETQRRIRNLESDKIHLDEHCQHLQKLLRNLDLKDSDNKLMKKSTSNMEKRPFISTVRSGELLAKPLCPNIHVRCSKCNTNVSKQQPQTGGIGASAGQEVVKLENSIKDLTDQVNFFKRKVEARDREIRRLNDLLSGGRPTAALAKDCCYKDIGALAEDIQLLQREKSENLYKISEYQNKMHEAMQRAMDLENKNKKHQKELEELKDAALAVETQANAEIEEREKEIDELKENLAKLKVKSESATSLSGSHDDKRKLNELIQKESELRSENERLFKKNKKLKAKLAASERGNANKANYEDRHCDEDRVRLKSERDFFQKEYLKMISKVGSEKETDFLVSQIKLRDEELRVLRATMLEKQLNNKTENSKPHECVQAVVSRVERERDVIKAELDRVQMERDALRKNLQSATEFHIISSQKIQEEINGLSTKVIRLEAENRELSATHRPTQTQVVLLKEEIECLKSKLFESQDENCKLKISHNKLKLHQEHTERTLTELQNKLLTAETKLETAREQLSTCGTHRDSSKSEISALRDEIMQLKSTYVKMENEKDKIIIELDSKTEKVCQLESDLKATKDKRNELERQVKDMEQRLERSLQRDSDLDSTTTECKSLHQQIIALKTSREKVIEENNRLSTDLAERQAEILTLKRRLQDSEVEIDRLKQQLKQYVEEVRKAEDLLLHKEREREEMLDHYRSLSHDAVLLEGNNHCLETEAAECKRQLAEAEEEILNLKKEVAHHKEIISKLETQISSLKEQNFVLENQLEEALDEQKLLKVDLSAQKELCDKMFNQSNKLNAEVYELNEVRKRLERQINGPRTENTSITRSQRVTTNTAEELLQSTRRDLEQQLRVDCKLSQELIRMKQRNEELLRQLCDEQDKRRQNDALVQEYNVQNQELRHNLTDTRFHQAKAKEENCRFTTM